MVKFKGLLNSFRQMLWPGIGIKRWLLLLGLGALAAGVGFFYLLAWLYQSQWLPETWYLLITLQFMPIWLRFLLPLFVGIGVIMWAVQRIGNNLIAPFGPREQPMAEMLYSHRRRNRGPNIVAIGGGTGMPSLLRGLRQHTQNITAIVTVADDGGSSGRLRREYGLLPPGDFRNNIAALSRDEALMTQVLQYRFGGNIEQDEPNELRGHAFGNLLLAALTGITGSFDEALLAAERVLAMRGRVLPSTLEDVALVAEIVREDGTIDRVVGESAIPEANGRIKKISLHPATIRAYPPTLKAIFQADLIVMGPGSLYTSILPNLLVPDLSEALTHAKAPKLYVCNLATQPGETDNYTVADHVAAILQHISTGCLDMVLANDNLSISPRQGGGNTIYVQPVAPEGVQMVMADLVDEKRPWRHDSEKLAQAVLRLLA
jgi:uncharacterized cofD-like protein